VYWSVHGRAYASGGDQGSSPERRKSGRACQSDTRRNLIHGIGVQLPGKPNQGPFTVDVLQPDAGAKRVALFRSSLIDEPPQTQRAAKKRLSSRRDAEGYA
jgi:hypothetical protein